VGDGKRWGLGLFFVHVYDYRLPTVVELEQIPNGDFQPWTTKPDRSGETILIVRQHLSERYKMLVNYLATGRWREADQETAQIMLAAVGRSGNYINGQRYWTTSL
jgi:hypothetical protein